MFYASVYNHDILAYGSEKNFYIRADLADIWSDFSCLVKKAVFDDKGRAVVDLRRVIGKGRILPRTTLKTVIFLKRDKDYKELFRELSPERALEILEENGYFNPHLLIKNDFKRKLRSGFFKKLLETTRVYEINTAGTPEERQKIIRALAGPEEI